MSLPWVSRARYDMDVHFARFERDTARVSDEMARHNLAEMHRMYDSLFASYHSLKAAGAVVVPEPFTPVSIQPAEPDPLKALIHAKSGQDFRLRAMMLRQLAEDQAADVPPEEIEKRIREGITSDGVPA